MLTMQTMGLKIKRKFTLPVTTKQHRVKSNIHISSVYHKTLIEAHGFY